MPQFSPQFAVKNAKTETFFIIKDTAFELILILKTDVYVLMKCVHDLMLL